MFLDSSRLLFLNFSTCFPIGKRPNNEIIKLERNAFKEKAEKTLQMSNIVWEQLTGWMVRSLKWSKSPPKGRIQIERSLWVSLKQLFNISSPKNNSIQKSLTLFVYIAQCKWCWPCSVFPNENIANESSLLSRSESSTNIAHIEVRMMSLVCELSVHQRIRIKQRRTAIDSETPYRSHSFLLVLFWVYEQKQKISKFHYKFVPKRDNFISQLQSK